MKYVWAIIQAVMIVAVVTSWMAFCSLNDLFPRWQSFCITMGLWTYVSYLARDIRKTLKK